MLRLRRVKRDMKKEQIEKRLTEIAQAKEQTVARYNSLDGREAELRFWLSEIAKEESEAVKPKDAEAAPSDEPAAAEEPQAEPDLSVCDASAVLGVAVRDA